MHFRSGLSRRDALQLALAGVSAAVPGRLSPALAAGTINFADIGVGDPNGDWTRYTKASGYNVNLVSIGNAPSAILNVLVAGGGTGTYDIINIVGGMQKPLVDNNLIDELDTSKLPAWAKNKNIGEFLAVGSPGFNFIGYNGKIYGCRPCCRATASLTCPKRRDRSIPMRRCLIPSSGATSPSRTTTPPQQRRPPST